MNLSMILPAVIVYGSGKTFEPVEVPIEDVDPTQIVCGHQRFQVLKDIGAKTVMVRYLERPNASGKGGPQ